MDIVITSDKKIRDIQKIFQKRFPYLKIEMFDIDHEIGEGTGLAHVIDNNKTISEVCSKNKEGILNLNGLMKVSELESAFMDVFGMSVQVFRKSNNVWIQTTKTDDWILAEQNQKARESQYKV